MTVQLQSSDLGKLRHASSIYIDITGPRLVLLVNGYKTTELMDLFPR
jgi:hypothetical protein